jgi:hypothetical protein
MGFEDIFDSKRKFHSGHGSSDYHQNNRNTHDTRYPYYGHDNSFSLPKILLKIKNNKKLKLLMLFAVALILVTVVALIIVLMPLILKLFNYISQNGLQGLLDYVTGFMDKILKGSPK